MNAYEITYVAFSDKLGTKRTCRVVADSKEEAVSAMRNNPMLNVIVTDVVELKNLNWTSINLEAVRYLAKVVFGIK